MMKYVFSALLLSSLLSITAYAQEGGSFDVGSDEMSEAISTDCETGTCGSAHVNSDLLTENAHKAALQAKGTLGTSTRPGSSGSGSNNKVND
jgi:hypothetical protein